MPIRLRDEFDGVKRLVIKVGSNVVSSENGRFRARRMRALVEDICLLKQNGIQVLLVSSGAVSIGKNYLSSPRLNSIQLQQAASSIGQPILMGEYQKLFHSQDHVCSQMLLTHDDFKSRRRFLNAKNTLDALLTNNATPILNENDTISFREITVGDNDHLAAKACALMEADALVLITSARGLMDRPPEDASAKLITEVAYGAPINAVYGGNTAIGRGGMKSKVEAVQKALELSVRCLISSKDLKRPIIDALSTAGVGTFFHPKQSSSSLGGKKLWVAAMNLSEGAIHIDDGAAKALLMKKSLLPTGIKEVEGDFEAGECVSVINRGKVLARGISSFDSHEARAIMGMHSSKVKEVFGSERETEVIHTERMIIEEKAVDICL